GTPTASISAGVNGATFLTANGTLATTALQSLVLGNSTTGNILLAPGGTTALTATGANLSGAGTFTSSGLITANGGITAPDGTLINLSGITHTNGVNEGFRLPQTTLSAGQGPSSGNGYLAYDPTGSGTIKYWNGTQWVALASA